MDKQTNNRKNYGTAYYAMAFLAAFFFEFYWIMTSPYDYFMLLGLGIIMIIMGYLTIDSILKAKADSEAAKAEQNDMMLKAQKAIYIATKKNAKDAEIRQAQSVKAMELMMNKMITSQQALLEDKKSDDGDMSSLIDQLSASNAKLAKEVQSAITVNQLVKANADLVRNVKEALSASAMNSSSPADLSSYVNDAVGNVSQPQVAPTPVPQPVVMPEPVIIPEPVAAPEPVVIPEPVVTPEPVITPEPVVTETVEIPEMISMEEAMEIPEMVSKEEAMEIPEMVSMEEAVEIPEPTLFEEPETVSLNEFDMSEMPSEDVMDTDTLSAMENEINMAQMEESEALEAMTIPDEMTPELDAAMDDGDAEEIIMDADSPFTPPVDDSPNRQLTEEEIAALFASL